MELPKAKTTKVCDLTRQNVLIYGQPKVGKTTLASQWPQALFVATEKGHDHVEIYKLDINNWDDAKELLATLVKNEEHGYKTLVIDIVDWLYKHCEDWVMKENKVTHPSDLPFGKGFTLVKAQFTKFVNFINQNLGMNIVFISHAKEREIKTKTSSWTQMSTTLTGQIDAYITGLCDYIFYIYIDDKGQRVARTKPTKYVMAGDRSGKLPELIVMDEEFSLAKLQGMLKGEK